LCKKSTDNFGKIRQADDEESKLPDRLDTIHPRDPVPALHEFYTDHGENGGYEIGGED
jgi:hypothetical protein